MFVISGRFFLNYPETNFEAYHICEYKLKLKSRYSVKGYSCSNIKKHTLWIVNLIRYFRRLKIKTNQFLHIFSIISSNIFIACMIII